MPNYCSTLCLGTEIPLEPSSFPRLGAAEAGHCCRSIAITKDENRRRPIPPVLLYLSRPFSYLRENIKMRREAGGSVFRPYLRDPVFSRDKSVFFVFIKSGKNINRHIIYPLMLLNIRTCTLWFNRRKQEILIIFLKNSLCKEVCFVLYSCKMSGD